MTTALQAPPLPEIDEAGTRERIEMLLQNLSTNEAIAEFYDDLRAQVAYRTKQLANELFFETNFLRMAEAELTKRMGNAKRLPVDGFEVKREQKIEKEYNASGLMNGLAPIITKKELEKAVWVEELLKTNGTAINKLARDYGEDSDVAKIIKENMKEVESGRPKFILERK
jgi:hypothetical protein